MTDEAIGALDGPETVIMDRRRIDRLAAAGRISAEARDFALELIEPPRRWGVWAGRLMTVVGAAMVLAGIVWFFAFNWDAIPPLAKLGGIAVLLAAAVAGVLIGGFDRLSADVAGTASVLLVGVFMAVDGQIHQTGADAWQLFAGWAVLTLGWALTLRSAAAWALWIAVAHVALLFWWDQARPAHIRISSLELGLIVFDGGLLALREVLVARGHRWPAARWTRFYLALPILAAIVMAMLELIGAHYGYDLADWTTVVVAPAALAALLVVYRRVLPDLAMLSATAIAGCGIVDHVLFQVMMANRRGDDIGAFFMLGLTTLGLFAAAVTWLRGVARSLEAGR